MPIQYGHLTLLLFMMFHLGLYTMQELLYLGEIVLVLVWFQSGNV